MILLALASLRVNVHHHRQRHTLHAEWTSAKALKLHCIRSCFPLKPYMSPELFNGAKFGTAVDMWATGVVAYELLMGVLPFAGGGKSGTAPRGSGGSVSTDSSCSIVTGCGSGPDSSFRNSNSSSRGTPPRPASLRASGDRDGLRRENRARKESKKTWRERVRADIVNGEYTVEDGAVGYQGRRFIEKVSGLVGVLWDAWLHGARGSGRVSCAGSKLQLS